MAAAKPEPTPAPVTPAANSATAAPAAAPAASQPVNIPMPSADWIPGGNAGEKALLVVGILVLGLALWSRITDTSFNLGLTGFTGKGLTAKASTPSPAVASQPIPATTARRMAVINPAKVSA